MPYNNPPRNLYDPFNYEVRCIDPATGIEMVNRYDGHGWVKANRKPSKTLKSGKMVKHPSHPRKTALRASQSHLSQRLEKSRAEFRKIQAQAEAEAALQAVSLHEQRGERAYRRALGLPTE